MIGSSERFLSRRRVDRGRAWRRAPLISALAWLVGACGDGSSGLEIAAGALPSGAVGVPYNTGNGTTCAPSRNACAPCFVGGTTRACPANWRYQNSFAFDANDGTAPYFWSATALPPGITVPTDGSIRGNPTTAGSYTATVRVDDSSVPQDHETAAVSIVIDTAPPPTIATAPAVATAAINRPYLAIFSVANGALPLTWSEAGALPPGLTFASSGVLSGTPTAAGAFPITVMVEDAFAQSATPVDVTIDVVEHGFRATGRMVAARTAHTATLLESGAVFVAGGYDGSKAVAAAELFDPASGTFAATDTLTEARHHHAATLLKDGRVLLTGGVSAAAAQLATAEVFDPDTGRFFSTGRAVTARSAHSATLLDNGTVLIAGGIGSDGEAIANAEIYNPATGTFGAVRDMTVARSAHTATLLDNGDVLVVGGVDETGAPLASAEIFDAVSHRFSATGNLATARANHAAMLLANGDVLIAGGLADAALPTAELYDAAAGTFTVVTMGTERSAPTATLLGDGTVLLTGGGDAGWRLLSSAESYDPVTGAFASTGSMSTARDGHAATLLSNGRVLITGGSNGAVLSSAEIYQ